FKRPRLELNAESLDRLMAYTWPGNVRELQNVIERAVILAQSSIVVVEPHFLMTAAAAEQPSSALTDVERQHILQVLQSAQWRIHGPRGAAAQLSMNPSTLRSRMKKLGITRPNLPIGSRG
ncbi:MAG TPA: helix-turn-helix domain-containing protein, partial [Nitrospira sp.]|nr:helix-turn-helix domain-containing protein [Nitrospira sp.]